MSRVVVTGIGVVSPIGLTVEEFWRNLTEGVSGVGPVSSFDASPYACRIAGEVKDFDPGQYMDAKAARRASRFVQFAVAATRMALADAGLTIDEHNRDSVGVVMNTGGGGMTDVVEGERIFLTKGPNRVSPLLIPALIPNMASCQVSMLWGIHGPVITSIEACASGIYALVEAKRLIDLGEAIAVIAGSSEAALIPVVFAALCNMRALSTRNDEPQKACRPFDLNRDGFVPGEGAGVMILERYEDAKRRGAPIYAEVAGGSLTADAYHVTAPDPNGYGAALAMNRALKSAGVGPEEVDYICAHGTGTPLNDVSETLSIKKVFGEHAYRVPISSPKSMVGHLMGAAGAISSIACVLAIRDGIIPPTINLETPDPECDLDYVPNVARRAPVRVAMANGFGFGGQNSVAVFRAFQE
ncbi:MAG: beta-ketoacyl-ACP synthase II [Dehalococcoidia bacterium]